MIMQDYAYKDSRSVTAMLRGHGDKRESAWLKYEKYYRDITQEEVMSQFAKEVRYSRINTNCFFKKYLIKLDSNFPPYPQNP